MRLFKAQLKEMPEMQRPCSIKLNGSLCIIYTYYILYITDFVKRPVSTS